MKRFLASIAGRRAAPCSPPPLPFIIPNPAPGIAYIEPRFARSTKSTFVGAALPVCGVDVLIVVVQPSVLASSHESALYVIAFQTRFKKTIVLVAQNALNVPTFYGPAGIVNVLCTLPLEMIPWRRMQYRVPRGPAWQLPIPRDPAPTEGSDRSSISVTSSMVETVMYDGDLHARATHTTRR